MRAIPLDEIRHQPYCIRSMTPDKSKIMDAETALSERQRLKKAGKTVVFTNGCFDLMHPGHVDYLTFAKKQGDILMVGLNSDRSVRKNKGDTRPILPENDRAKVLAALEMVDYVVIFDEEEPAALIEKIIPDILVKGEDWAHYVSGREIVEKNGGKVVLAPLVEGKSTSNIIEKIKNLK